VDRRRGKVCFPGVGTMTREQEDILALYGVPGVGSRIFARLTALFGTAGAVLEASKRELMLVEGVGPALAENIRSHDGRKFVEEQRRLMERAGAVMITRSDGEYPPVLNTFPSAPPVLFVRGDVSALRKTSIAFVGTRRPSPYGIKMTRKLAGEAVRAGMCVVSGMAAGIDTAAHRAALDEGGTTVAVFGCGVDVVYPSENRRLSREIEKSGCLVSHFPMGTQGNPGNFPARNSVIVGLSLGTVVVEAPEKSGALITADLTLRAGRRLFTVPGPADSPTSAGTNSLLCRGALPVSSFRQVLSALGETVHPAAAPKERKSPPGGLAGEIVKVLEEEPLHVERICALLKKSVSEVLSELTFLEIEGFVSQRPGKIFERL